MNDETTINKGGAPLGNQNAKKNKPFLDAMRKAIAQNPQKIRNIVEKILDEAEKGEAWAVKEIADRLDGKAHQSTSLEDADGNSLLQAIEVRFIKPSE